MHLGKWKDSDNIGYFLVGTIIFGIVMGMANSFGTVWMKGTLKDINDKTDLLPESFRKELSPPPSNQ